MVPKVVGAAGGPALAGAAVVPTASSPAGVVLVALAAGMLPPPLGEPLLLMLARVARVASIDLIVSSSILHASLVWPCELHTASRCCFVLTSWLFS